MWMMGIANSYTMEASFGGSLLGNKAETHFGTQDYEHMGRLFCQTLLDFYDDDPRKVYKKIIILFFFSLFYIMYIYLLDVNMFRYVKAIN